MDSLRGRWSLSWCFAVFIAVYPYGALVGYGRLLILASLLLQYVPNTVPALRIEYIYPSSAPYTQERSERVRG